jgi:hypothetical protein
LTFEGGGGLEQRISGGLVLGFGGIRPVEIEAGVAVLGEILEQQWRRR